MNKDLSIWLVPEKNQRIQFQQIIDNLASKYQAYKFIPHITLYYLSNSTPVETAKQIISNITLPKPIKLKAIQINHSDLFTKTIYIEYELNEQLNQLYSEYKKEFSKYIDYKISPHLSLIYKNNMDAKLKEKEIAVIEYPQNIILDKALLISKEGGTISQERDVLNWKIELSK